MAPEERQKVPSGGASRSWDALTPALSEWILEAVTTSGFNRMTPVQASTIPLFTGNKDVVVEAVTGSGKTLAFLIPVVEKLLRVEEPIRKHHVGGIIISPTRELASQINSVLLDLLAFHPPSAVHLQPPDDTHSAADQDNTPQEPAFPPSTPKIVPQLLLGGTTPPAQDLAHFLERSPNLLVSTPGRLLELLSSPHVHCPQSSFEVLVLDEADRLLDLGFKQDLQKILSRLPKQRRTGLFSASVSEAVDQLVRVGLRNPIRIAVKVKSSSSTTTPDLPDDQRVPASLQLRYLVTPPDHKLLSLLSLLSTLDPAPTKSIAYVSTCAQVDYLSRLLPALHAHFHPSKPLRIVPLHGKHQPAVRAKNFTAFLTSAAPQTLLLTTDLAARGLDIPAVDLTVQLDPPSDPKTFLHRAGRAGRAGRPGLAVVFLLPGREATSYPPFLAVRRTRTTPLAAPTIAPTSAAAATAAQLLRALVLTDRALHDAGQRAFVSWVRAYSKHAAASVFRVAELDWKSEARGWGLLRLPRMPELRGTLGDAERGVDGVVVDWDEYAYKDKAREEKRRREMHDGLAPAGDKKGKGLAAVGDKKGNGPSPAGDKKKGKAAEAQAWSRKTEQKETKDARREKRGAKRKAAREAGMTEVQKEYERETQSMLAEVRKRNRTTGKAGEEEFAGFGD